MSKSKLSNKHLQRLQLLLTEQKGFSFTYKMSKVHVSKIKGESGLVSCSSTPQIEDAGPYREVNLDDHGEQ